MFIKCNDGSLVNLNMVAEIYISDNYNKTKFSVMATTGTSSADYRVVDRAISKHASREDAQESIDVLFKVMREHMGIGYLVLGL